MPWPTRGVVRRRRWLVWPLAFVLSGVLVSTASYSAFTATDNNAANSFAVGTVNLTADDGGTAMFSATNLKPGSTGTKCIVVTSTGTLPSSVKLYATSASTTKGFGGYLTLAITLGTGGSFGSCTGFTALSSGSSLFSGTFDGFVSTAAGYGTGLGTWTPTGTASESRTYRVVYTVSSTIPDTAQAGTAAVGFTWETQNT